MSMCVLNMNSGRVGAPHGSNLTDCVAAAHNCHQQACTGGSLPPHHQHHADPQPTHHHTPTTTTAGMVVDLSGLLHGDRGLDTAGLGQIALLPVRLGPPTTSGHDAPLSAVPVSAVTHPVLTVHHGCCTTNSHHCAGCPFGFSGTGRDSGFSDGVSCDTFQLFAAAPVVSAKSGGDVVTTTTQHQQAPRYDPTTPPPTGPRYYDNGQLVGDRSHGSVVVPTQSDCTICKQQHQLHSYAELLRQYHRQQQQRSHHEAAICHHCPSPPGFPPSTQSSTCGIYENSSFHQRASARNHIPRIVCHSPGVGGGEIGATPATTDSGISSPTLPDHSTTVCPPQLGARPELLHSRSFQDQDLSQHLAQMAGGHLSIHRSPTSSPSSPSSSSLLRQHRHSTGSVRENLENQRNSFANTECGSTCGMVLSTSSTAPTIGLAHQGGGVRTSQSHHHHHHHQGGITLEQSPLTTTVANTDHVFQRDACGGSPTLWRPSPTNSTSDESNSAKTAMSSLSFGSDFGGDVWGGRRSSSPSDSSGGSCGDCSGSSAASGAQQFRGAADNKLEWTTLELSTNRLSKCDFYYPQMSMEQAKLKLKPLAVGSFLVRDSSNKHYLYSLSAKTPRGVTSVRIEYRGALFRLDSDMKSAAQMPGFDCVLKLIQHYVQLTENKRTKKCVWLESSGRKDTPVMLIRPATQGISSLTHLCRKVIHKTVPMERMTQNLKTDFTLLEYLREYPYHV